MTRTSTAHMAVAADYADALMTARRAKNLLFLLMLLILLGQLTVFFLVKYNVLKLDSRVTVNATVTPPTPAAPAPMTITVPTTVPSDGSSTDPAPATQPTMTITVPSPAPAAPAPTTVKTSSATTAEILQYVIPATNFLGVVLSVLFAIVLLLLTTIMLVGRLVGVSHVTGAFIWSVFLALILFPWQAFLIHGEHYGVGSSQSMSSMTGDDAPPQPAFKVPGVLYTFPELSQDYDFKNQPLPPAIVKWARYAAFPVLALLILLVLQGKSSRGLKQALGETEMHVEVSNRGNDPLL